MQNENVWNVQELQMLLKLARHFINFNEPLLFRVVTVSKNNEFLLRTLKSTNFNQSFELICNSVAGSIASEASRDEELNITSHDWANFIKDAMIQSPLLDEDNLKILAAKLVYVESIKPFFLQYIAMYKNFQNNNIVLESEKDYTALFELSASQIQGDLLQLMGQLCALGAQDSAHVIHEYLRLAASTYENAASNLMDLKALSVCTNMPLCRGLGIFDFFEAADLHIKTTYHFFGHMMERFLAAPQFTEPFHPERYRLKQDEVKYHQVYHGLKNKLSLPNLKLFLNGQAPHVNTAANLTKPASANNLSVHALAPIQESKNLLFSTPVQNTARTPSYETTKVRPTKIYRSNSDLGKYDAIAAVKKTTPIIAPAASHEKSPKQGIGGLFNKKK